MKFRNMAGVYLLKDGKILLLYRQGSRVVDHLWIPSAGGHLEEYEINDPKACVLRELNEEMGLCEGDLQNLRLKYITLRKINGEIRVNYYFFADLARQGNVSLKSNEGVLKWFETDELEELEMPFTSKPVLRHYLSQGIFDDRIYVGTANEKDVDFSELS